MAKKKKAKGTQKWQARPNDAIRLAALHWFALELERTAIEIYATDQASFHAMERVFRQALKEMRGMHRGVNALSDDECPDGYIRCKDNTCAPACDGVIGIDSDS